MALEREDERIYISLGQCLYEAGRYAQALKAYDDGIRVARFENVDYYLMLGDALLANNQRKQAWVQWRRALSLRSGVGDDELSKETEKKMQLHCHR